MRSKFLHYINYASGSLTKLANVNAVIFLRHVVDIPCNLARHVAIQELAKWDGISITL